MFPELDKRQTRQAQTTQGARERKQTSDHIARDTHFWQTKECKYWYMGCLWLFSHLHCFYVSYSWHLQGLYIPNCFKTTRRGNLSTASSGQIGKARKAQGTPALVIHKGRAGEKHDPSIRFSKQYLGITFCVCRVLSYHWRRKRGRIFQTAM